MNKKNTNQRHWHSSYKSLMACLNWLSFRVYQAEYDRLQRQKTLFLLTPSAAYLSVNFSPEEYSSHISSYLSQWRNEWVLMKWNTVCIQTYAIRVPIVLCTSHMKSFESVKMNALINIKESHYHFRILFFIWFIDGYYSYIIISHLMLKR